MKIDQSNLKKIGGFWKIIVPLMLGIVTLIIITINAWRSQENFENLMLIHRQDMLMETAQMAGHNIKDLLGRHVDQLFLLSQNDKLAEMFQPDSNQEQISNFEILKTFYEVNKRQFDALYALNTEGLVLKRFPERKGDIGQDYAEKPAVKKVIEKRQPVLSDIFVTGSGKNAISFVLPVSFAGKYIGMLRILLYANNFLQKFLNNINRHNMTVFLMSRSGKIIAHPESYHIGQNYLQENKKKYPQINWQKLEVIVDDILQGNTGTDFFFYHHEGKKNFGVAEKVLIAYFPIQIFNRQIAVVATMPYAHVIDPIRVNFWNIIVAAGTLFIILAGLGLFSLLSHKKNVFLKQRAESLNQIEKAAKALNKSEESLSQSNQMLQTVLNAIPVRVFWKDKNLNFLGCNRLFALDSGFKKAEDLIGQDDFAMAWKNEAEIYRADDRKVLETGERKLNYEEMQTTPQGKTIWLETSKIPLQDIKGNIIGILGLYQDITERKLAEKSLRLSEERFRQLAENIKQVFWIVSSDWQKVHYVSPAFKNFWETDPKILYERPLEWFEAILPEDRRQVENFIKANSAGNPVMTSFPEFRIRRPNGSIRRISIRAFPVTDEKGSVYRIAGIAEDITERRQAEELMIQTEKMMSVGGLAAGMAHELNNPLGGILQAVQNIIRRFSPDLPANHSAAEEYGIDLHQIQSYMEKRRISFMLEGIIDSGQRAANIISDMLQFSRKSESNLVPVNLATTIEKSLELAGKDYNLKKKFDFRSIKIIAEFDQDLPLVPCNETEIQQVMLNLLSNAAHAMAEKTQGDGPQIILRLRVDGNSVRIEVEDNGPGIDLKTQKRIFEPFFTTKPEGQGTGLGLSVSYMIITNNHQGTIEIDSELGKGSKFIVRLPLTRENLPVLNTSQPTT